MFQSAHTQEKDKVNIMAKNVKTTTTPAVKVRGGKTGKSRERRSFWDRALQAPKVREALLSLNVPEAKFEAAYNLTRKVRERGEITEAQTVALKAFAEHRNIRKFAEAIGKSDVYAATLLGRAMEAKIL